MRNIIPLCIALICCFMARGQTKWSLTDCIAIAYKNNVQLNQQKLISETSKVYYDQAKANLLPNLNFSDAQSFSFGNTVISGGNQVLHQNITSNEPSLTSNVIVFNGFKYMNLVKENKLEYEASQLDIETEKNNLALNITAAYVQLLFEYDAVTIAQHQVESDSIQVKKMEIFVGVGQTPEDSLLLIKAQLATDKAAKVSAENQVELASVQLQQLMELPIASDFQIIRTGKNEIADMITNAADIYKIAEDILPDVKSAELKTRAFETDILVNKAAFLPTLNLSSGLESAYYSTLSPLESYQITYQNEMIGYLQNDPAQKVYGPVPVTVVNSKYYPLFSQFKNNFSQVISLNLTVPIFNNFKAHNNIKLARIAAENARLNEQAVKNTLRKSVETAYTNLLSGSKNFIATREQLISETKAYNDMLRKYNVGMATLTDFLIEENNYYKAMLANLQAEYEYIFETKIVAFYTGTPLTQ